jgi:L-iditol 2-dehydrogenase
VSYEQAALTEPIGVSLHAVRLSRVAAGEDVCILGAGIIGIAALWLCRRAGARRITVVEPVPERSALARASGADAVAGSNAELLAAGFEADILIECSGDQEGLDQCVGLARPGGRIVVVGIPRDERITFDMAVARRRELSIVFSRRSHDTLAEAIRLVASNELDVSLLPLRRFSLEQTREALELTGRPGPVLRAVVYP